MSTTNGAPLMVSQGPPPPKVTGAYKTSDALVDLPGVRYAVSLFLESHMVECEEWCDENDPKKERLYYASGYGLIQTVKALMSYEDEVCLIHSILHWNKNSTEAAGRIFWRPLDMPKILSLLQSLIERNILR